MPEAIQFTSTSDAVRISLPMRLDSRSFESLQAAWLAERNSIESSLNRAGLLQLDLGNTRMIDSTGLNFLFQILQLAESCRAKVTASGVQTTVKIALRLARLDTRLGIA